MKDGKMFIKYCTTICLVISCIFSITACSSKENKDDTVKETQTNIETDSQNTQETTASLTDEKKTYLKLYEESGKLPNLSEVYKDLFSVGVAVEREDIRPEIKQKFIAEQFDSITCGNEMKADFTLDRKATLAAGNDECPAINMAMADVMLNYAMKNGLKMRGHTLVWHSQTPRWLFTVGYDDSAEAPLVTREVMLVRMENYIRQVIEHVNTNYPNVIYAWDVVNEAFNPSEGQEKGMRMKDSYWYTVVGDDFIEQAFTFARKYADPEQKLFYNDYGTYEKDKLIAICNMAEELKKKDLIDGIGMQSHIQMSYPSLSDYEDAVIKYGKLGLEVQITELDIDAGDNSDETQEKLATRYRRILMTLEMLKKNGSANITNVTFWGLTDDRTWLNYVDSTPSWPLLFDKDLKPKSAYFGVLQDDSVKLY